MRNKNVQKCMVDTRASFSTLIFLLYVNINKKKSSKSSHLFHMASEIE